MNIQLFPLDGPVELTESKNISTLNLTNPLIQKRGQMYQFHRMFMGTEQFRLKRSSIQATAGRSFIALQIKFEKELTNLIKFLRNSIPSSLPDAQEAAREEEEFRAYIKKKSKKIFYEYYRKAYFLGVKAAGAGISQSYQQLIFKDSADPKITKEEDRWVKTAAAAEMKFWGKFLNNAAQYKEVNRRIGMYVTSLEGTYNAGRVAGSPNNSLVYWLMDKKTHVSCPECDYLADNSPWTKDFLPTTPKAGMCSCLFNCRCALKILPTTQEEYKKASLVKPTRSQAIRKIKGLSI